MGFVGSLGLLSLLWLAGPIQGFRDDSKYYFTADPKNFNAGEQVNLTCGDQRIELGSAFTITLTKGSTKPENIASLEGKLGNTDPIETILSDSYRSRADITVGAGATGGIRMEFTIKSSTCEDKGSWACTIIRIPQAGSFSSSHLSQTLSCGGDSGDGGNSQINNWFGGDGNSQTNDGVGTGNYRCFACTTRPGDTSCKNPSEKETEIKSSCNSCVKIVADNSITRSCSTSNTGNKCETRTMFGAEVTGCLCTSDLCNGAMNPGINLTLSVLAFLLVWVLQLV